MERRRSLTLARGLLVLGGIAVALVGWKAVAAEREASRLGAIEGARADVEEAAWRLSVTLHPNVWRHATQVFGEPASTFEMVAAEGRPAPSAAEGTPEDWLLLDEAIYRARARDDIASAREMLERIWQRKPGTSLGFIAAGRAGALAVRAGDADAARAALGAATLARRHLKDDLGVPVRLAALYHLAVLDLAEGKPEGVVQFLEGCDDGHALLPPGIETADLLAALWERARPALEASDRVLAKRVSDALDEARSGQRWIAAVRPHMRVPEEIEESRSRDPGGWKWVLDSDWRFGFGTVVAEGRLLVATGGKLLSWPLDVLVAERLMGTDWYDSHARRRSVRNPVRIAETREGLPPAAVSADVSRVPGGSPLVVWTEPAEGSAWTATALAFGAGLLVYLLGAGFALAAISRSARAARMQDEFVAAVSHEMKTPIAAVSAMAEMLANGRAPSPERAREYAERIRAEMQRLGTTVRNVLDASRIERGMPRLVSRRRMDPSEVVRTVADVVRPSLEARGFRFDVDVSPPPRPLPLDPDALTSVLGNLLDNAAKFSKDRKEVLLRGVPTAGGYRIEVLDRGPGVPRAEQARVFGRFQRGAAATRDAVPGVGLGLHVAKELVEAHGGTIRVEDREGGGAAFVVELPGGNHSGDPM